MANQKNIIELNGKRYDALTGDIVTTSPKKQPTKTSKLIAKPLTTASGSLDGFSRSSKASALKPPAQVIHQKAQSSKTLMRRAVKKPQHIFKQPVQHQHPGTVVQPVAGIQHSSKSLVDPDRLSRAEHIHQSKLINKFSDGAPRKLGKPSLLPLSVAPGPEVPQLGKVATLASRQRFQSAVDHATSHEQPAFKKSHFHNRISKKLHLSTRILSIGSGSLAVLLIGGFIAYQNVPNLAMHIAAARAGIHASLPSYKPAGFAISGPITYKPGQITVSFKSNSDNSRNFSITQSVSSWNSETLLENYVSMNKQPYQTYEDSGKTIYIYNGSNATWVDSGIWYNVQGNSSLNSDQLLRIAKSI